MRLEGKDEAEENRFVQRRLQAKTAMLDKIKHSTLPLAKVLRHEEFKREAAPIVETMDRIREKYPEVSALADKILQTIPAYEVFKDFDTAFPEVREGKQSDLQIFDFLAQFIDEKDQDPKMLLVRDYLVKEETRKKDKAAKEFELDTREAALLSSHFPEQFKVDTATVQQRMAFDDARLGPSFDEATAEIVQKIETGTNLKQISRAEFFADVDRSDPQEMEKREKLWKKYDQFLKLAELADAAGEKTAEVEPVLDTAINHQYAFRPSALGKYIRFNTREQRKYLPEGWCGKLEHREFVMTKETSLMMRQPSLDLIEKLKQAEAASFSTRRGPKPSILYGRPGVGKSAALQLAVYWARKNDWLVVNLKSATKWVHGGGIIQKSKIMPGCWDQPYLGVKFLEHMLDAHTDKLKQIPLRTDISLGKFEGKTLFDLVEYGAALHEYSCEVVVYFKRELERVIEFPVLIAIDDYNSLYNYNQRFREPETTHFFPRKLRNCDLTLTKIFMDSHLDPKLVNGYMIGAVSREPSYRHFSPDEHKTDDWVQVQPFSQSETAKVFQHYERTGYVLAQTSSGTQEVVRQLTSGQGHEIWKWCKAL